MDGRIFNPSWGTLVHKYGNLCRCDGTMKMRPPKITRLYIHHGCTENLEARWYTVQGCLFNTPKTNNNKPHEAQSFTQGL